MEFTESGHYLSPKFAYKKMHLAESERNMVYLYGISGSGKTEFIQHTLKKKNYVLLDAENLSLYELPSIKDNCSILVIDNLHELYKNADYEHICKAIIELSERKDLWLLLVSRCPVPTWLKPTYLNKEFTIIKEEDLFFRWDELDKFYALWDITFTEEELSDILELTCGYPLVNKILAVRMQSEEKLTTRAIEQSRSDMWDYLDYHVYDQWDMDVQDFLMKMSIVDSFNTRLAEMITGIRDVEPLI